MKIVTLAVACCCAGLLAGCESGLTDEVRTALGPREAPRTRVFQAEQRATYEAARAAAEAMGYKFVRGGPAQGEIVALSGISRGDGPGSARQISMKVRLNPAAESGTEVEVAFTEIIEADSTNHQGLATQTPLRDTPLYEVFFQDVQNALRVPPKG